MADDKWFGRGFVTGTYKPPENTGGSGGGGDPYRRGRFYVKVGTKKPVVFLDSMETAFKYVEHVSIIDLTGHAPPKTFGQKIFFPCIHAMGQVCWLCSQKCPYVRALAMTVIDIEGYTSKKDNTVYRNIKRLFVVYEREMQYFIDKSKAVNGLKASMFQVGRYQKLGPTVGDDYTPILSTPDGFVANGKVTKKWVTDEKIDPAPLDYDKVIPFNLKAVDQENLFKENPNWTWDKARKEAAGGAVAADPGVNRGAGAATAEHDQAEEDIPF